MSEEQADYLAENGYISEAIEMLGKGYNDQPAAIIDPPRTVRALRDRGLVDYTVWGWVKTSAKFRAHIKILRGAKHDIWHYLALGVDEHGKCKETIKQICEGTGYSHTEVINTLRELDEMGYLSIQKDSRGNTYTPEFVARGEKKPTENVVKKVESSPVYQVESSPPIENSAPSIKRVKRVNTQFQKTTKQDLAGMSVEAAILAGVGVSQELQDKNILRQSAVNAFESAFGITRPWASWWGIDKDWKDLLGFIADEFQADADIFKRYVAWYDDKGKFGGGMNATQIKRDPALFFTAWDMFKRQDVKPQIQREAGKGFYA